ncbi:cellulase family glycosylhydrolase [Gryllotalpicola reticulitermitis]|uniref:mannan endo-1,4-beta-mannosidase n=1 Tax=Gryllotalpicola reticulitermitis TaxID=1184153 RepID=A0ABV8QCK2_9MICO
MSEPSLEPHRGVSRRGLLLGGGIAAATTAGAALLNPLAASAAPRASASGSLPNPWSLGRGAYVSRHGTALHSGGQAWKFGGTNTYYLHTSSHYMIDSALDNAGQVGLKVVRAWAFSDGTASGQAIVLQSAPYKYDEAAFDSLDYAVYKAGQLGIRLVLALTNNWGDYGGMPQYVKWFHPSLADDEYGDSTGNTPNHDLFYTDPEIRAAYFAYVTHVITRVNRYTGLAYRDDPTVMTWELANEPRNRSAGTGFGNANGAPLRSWADAASRLVKRLAPHQLVALGDEGLGLDKSSSDYPYGGYEGNNWVSLISLPAIDYGTFHMYPVGWGETTDPVGWGDAWIAAHAKAAATVGKPVALEEFGLPIGQSPASTDETTRDASYQSWLSTVESSGINGFQFWLLTALTDDGVLYGDYDGFRVVFPSSTATLMKTAAAMLAG